jgi:AraC family transcriptional regulator
VTPPPANIPEVYRARFRRVLEYIDTHLPAALTVEQLGRVAGFSKYHFHRQFSALLGLGVHEYVQLVRLNHAARELGLHPFRSVMQVALETGYESPEAFARAFKRHSGQTPSEFQSAPDWSRWEALCQPIRELRTEHMKPTYATHDVALVSFATTPVAALEHRGDPRRVSESVRRFIEWRREAGLLPRVSATFNIFWDNPETTAPDQYRMDICAATTGEVPPNRFGIVKKVIPEGRCAVLRHVGPDPLDATFRFLYETWLPSSGESPRDYPAFAQRVAFPPQVPEHESIVDIYLPLV